MVYIIMNIVSTKKNMIKNTRDMQVGKNKIFLRLPMQIILSDKLQENIEYKMRLDNRGHGLGEALNIIIFNQIAIWQKLKGK